jgi:hypothetical protein
VPDNKTLCLYLAKDEAIIRRHMEKRGAPILLLCAPPSQL